MTTLNVILRNTERKARKNISRNPKKEAKGVLRTSTIQKTHLKEANDIERRKRSTRKRAEGIEVMNVERGLLLVSSPLTVTVIYFWIPPIAPIYTTPQEKPLLIQQSPPFWTFNVDL